MFVRLILKNFNMKKKILLLLAVCVTGFMSANGYNNSELKLIDSKKAEALITIEDDEFWLCREVNRVEKIEHGIISVVITYECTWYTLEGPGVPPLGNFRDQEMGFH